MNSVEIAQSFEAKILALDDPRVVFHRHKINLKGFEKRAEYLPPSFVKMVKEFGTFEIRLSSSSPVAGAYYTLFNFENPEFVELGIDVDDSVYEDADEAHYFMYVSDSHTDDCYGFGGAADKDGEQRVFSFYHDEGLCQGDLRFTEWLQSKIDTFFSDTIHDYVSDLGL